jgi:hypothetical protein
MTFPPANYFTYLCSQNFQFYCSSLLSKNLCNWLTIRSVTEQTAVACLHFVIGNAYSWISVWRLNSQLLAIHFESRRGAGWVNRNESAPLFIFSKMATTPVIKQTSLFGVWIQSLTSVVLWSGNSWTRHDRRVINTWTHHCNCSLHNLLCSVKCKKFKQWQINRWIKFFCHLITRMRNLLQ